MARIDVSDDKSQIDSTKEEEKALDENYLNELVHLGVLQQVYP